MSSNNISMKRRAFRGAVVLLGLIAAVTLIPSAWADLATVTKTFSPASITAGTTSTLTVDIANITPGNPGSVGFTDSYPSTPAPGLSNTAIPTANGNCGSPTLTGAIGGSSLAMSGGSISGRQTCTVSVTVTACTVGTYTNPSFTVSSDRNSVNSNAAALTVTAGTPSAAASTVAASPTSLPADGTTTATITVTLKDACGNPVQGKTVTLSAGSGSSTISAASGPSNASGVVNFTVKDAVAEAVTYTATDISDSVIVTQTANVNFLAPSATTSTVVASPVSVAADGSTTSTITVTLLTSAGAPVAGKTVTLTAGSGSSIISVASGPSNASGVVSFTVKDLVVEAVTYTARDTTDGVTVTQTATVTFTMLGPLGPNHYELSLPTNSIACLGTTIRLIACTDASSPCSNPYASAGGQTANLTSSAGVLGAATVTFDATGVASTTLSYPAAPNGTLVSITLSGESVAASNPRQWCPNGVACVVANSGSTTFNTAGFIFSAAAGGAVATIPPQVAGMSSAANYLRAVKTSTTTQACEAALVGASAVDFAYECNNPASCYTSNLMSVNGGAATTIARNNNAAVASYLPVNLSFDANGNAPFTFNYADVGQVKLWARKTASGALLSTLAGASNSFVVKPHHFDITNISCSVVGAGTCAPANATGVNPAASGPAGGAFIQAGRWFKATVTAMNGAATPAFTPNFGKETPAEGAELRSFNHLPGLGGASAISRVLSGFNSGAATLTDLAWNEVGVLQLKASLSNANGYLGSDIINGKDSVVSAINPYVGRFIPDRFDTVVTAQGGGFAYSGNPAGPVPGQPFGVTVTARNASAAPTANYNNAGGYAKNVNLSLPVGGASGQIYVDALAGGAGALPAAKFVNGVGNVDRLDATGKISFVFNSLPNAEQAIQIHAEDADSVTSSGANGSINIRHGRLRLFNAFGSEQANLSLPLQAEYWTGKSWVLNSADSFTLIPAGSVALSAYTGSLSAANMGASHVTGATLASGQASIALALPAPAATGSVDVALNLGAGAADQSCLASHPATTGAAVPWLRSIYGNCALSYDRDPAARASFGIYAPETRKTIHVRELF